MFTRSQSGFSENQRTIVASSLAVHAMIFAWLLHAPEPRLLMPNSVARGNHGKVVTQLYWTSRSPDDSDTSSSDTAIEVYRHQRLAHDKLVWNRKSTLAKLSPSRNPIASYSAHQDDSKTATLSRLGHGAAAGVPYGGLPGSPVYGDEIRPALPITTADPAVYPWERPESEGKVVIEITIDERGEIVRKTVLQSLGSEIDNKCLAALENWHFQPATQNGSPIASKQDAIFPFKARG
jgi:TonB family protein